MNPIPKGTICRIREWDDMAREYGSHNSTVIYVKRDGGGMGFLDSMKHLCGQIFTVKEYRENEFKTYLSEEGVERDPGRNGVNRWYITAGMLEILEEYEPEPDDLVSPDLSELFT